MTAQVREAPAQDGVGEQAPAPELEQDGADVVADRRLRQAKPRRDRARGDALADELPHGPGADAAEGARDEEALVRARIDHASTGTGSTTQTFSSLPIRSISTDTRSPAARNRRCRSRCP